MQVENQISFVYVLLVYQVYFYARTVNIQKQIIFARWTWPSRRAPSLRPSAAASCTI